MEEGTPLLRILLNGELVASAELKVYDQAAAWWAFQEAFLNLSHLMVGEVFNTVRIACHDDLRRIHGPQGITIDLNTSVLEAV